MLGEISESPGGCPDRLAEQLGPGVLEQEPRRAGLQRAVDVLVQVEGGDDDDGDRVLDVRPGQLPGRLHAVEDRHPDVHQADVGTQLASQPNRLLPVARLPHDLDAVQRAEDQPKPGAHQVLVVGDQHADGHGGHLAGQRGVDGPAASGARARPAGAAEQLARSTIPISPNPDPGVAWAGSDHRRRRRAAARTQASPATRTSTAWRSGHGAGRW